MQFVALNTAQINASSTKLHCQQKIEAILNPRCHWAHTQKL